MESHSHLVDMLTGSASVKTGVVVVDGRGAETFSSWAQLVDDARRRARWLVDDHGLSPGEHVLIALPTSHTFVSSFLAVLMAGAVPLPVPRPSGLRAVADAQRLSAVATSCRARLVLVDVDLAALGPAVSAPLRRARIQTVVVNDDVPAAPRLSPRPGPVAFIQYTSGSTLTPRGVVVSEAAARAQLTALAEAMEVSDQDVAVSWLPLFHDMGLVGTLLLPMASSLQLVLLSPSTFLRRPARWLQVASAHRATLWAAPSSAFAMTAARARDAELCGLDLSSCRIALNGAEPVRREAVFAFAARFTPHGFPLAAMTPAYGLAEATLAVAMARSADGPRFTDDGNALVGAPLPGCRVTLDAVSINAAGLASGEILVEAPFVADGYLDDPVQTAASFDRGLAHGLAQARLRTGDIGAFVDGSLVVTGRKKDLIIVRGAKVHAEDVERVAEGVSGVRAHSAIAFAESADAKDGEGVVVVVAADVAADVAGRADRDRLIAAVRDAVGDHLGVAVHDVQVVPAADIPRTTSGKKQRGLARAQWRAAHKDLTLSPDVAA